MGCKLLSASKNIPSLHRVTNTCIRKLWNIRNRCYITMNPHWHLHKIRGGGAVILYAWPPKQRIRFFGFFLIPWKSYFVSLWNKHNQQIFALCGILVVLVSELHVNNFLLGHMALSGDSGSEPHKQPSVVSTGANDNQAITGSKLKR